MGYEYKSLAMNAEQRYVNPLGFRVTSYRVNPKLTEGCPMKTTSSAVVLSVPEARPLTLWRLRLAAILLMTIALKALFITLLMWSKLTLSPVWLPTLLSRLTKPISPHAFGDSESWTFAHKMNHFL